jgi:hypothetical protein
LNNTLLNNQRIKDKIREVRKFLEVNENENKTYQNLWDTAKVALTGKFIAMIAYFKNTESSQINDKMLHPNLLE